MFLTPRLPALVQFRDLQPRYVHGEDVLVVLEYAPGLEVTSKDWIGLFPAGWTNLQQFLAFNRAPSPKTDFNGHRILHTLVFRSSGIVPPAEPLPNGAPNLYQFVFVSDTFDAVLGSSGLFFLDPVNQTADITTGLKKDDQVTPKTCFLQQVPFPLCSPNNNPTVNTVSEGGWKQTSNTKSDTTVSRVQTSQPTKSQTNVELFNLNAPRGTECGELKDGTYEGVKRYLAEIFGLSTTADSVKQQQQCEQQPFIEMPNIPIKTSFPGNCRHSQILYDLSMKNASLIRENENIRVKYQQMHSLLQEKNDHMTNVYYSLHLKGFAAIILPEGDAIDLSQYKGTMLNLVQDDVTQLILNGCSKSRAREQDRKMLDDIFPSRTVSPRTAAGQEEQHKALLKSFMLTKSEQQNLDDYVSWLYDTSSDEKGPKRYGQEMYNGEHSEEDTDREHGVDDKPQREWEQKAGRDDTSSSSRKSLDITPAPEEYTSRRLSKSSPKRRLKHRNSSVGKLNPFLSARMSATATTGPRPEPRRIRTHLL